MGIDYAVNVGYGTKITKEVEEVLAKEFKPEDYSWEDYSQEVVYEIGSHIPGLNGWHTGDCYVEDGMISFIGYHSLHMDMYRSDGFTQTLDKKKVPNKKQIKQFAKKYGLEKPKWHVGLYIY